MPQIDNLCLLFLDESNLGDVFEVPIRAVASAARIIERQKLWEMLLTCVIVLAVRLADVMPDYETLSLPLYLYICYVISLHLLQQANPFAIKYKSEYASGSFASPSARNSPAAIESSLPVLSDNDKKSLRSADRQVCAIALSHSLVAASAGWCFLLVQAAFLLLN